MTGVRKSQMDKYIIYAAFDDAKKPQRAVCFWSAFAAAAGGPGPPVVDVVVLARTAFDSVLLKSRSAEAVQKATERAASRWAIRAMEEEVAPVVDDKELIAGGTYCPLLGLHQPPNPREGHHRPPHLLPHQRTRARASVAKPARRLARRRRAGSRSPSTRTQPLSHPGAVITSATIAPARERRTVPFSPTTLVTAFTTLRWWPPDVALTVQMSDAGVHGRL
mmetsp:Transcript_34754/g.112130  ORF Transcript_34754/g.112130 Transcript_34754/m.112130 type:complete len:221 (-) Transcript_34754:31-693(-)